MEQFDEFLKSFFELEAGEVYIQLAQFLFWVVLILVLSWLGRITITRTLSDNRIRYRAKKVIRFGAYVLIVLLAVISFTGRVQYFTVAIGLVSAGIVFALQEVILSFAGWITVVSSNVYKPGDRIEINQARGDVIDISLTKTTLMEIGSWVSSDNYSGRIITLSNAIVFKEVVHNYSTDFPFVWDEIKLPVQYGSDVDMANQLILAIARDLLSEYAGFARSHWKKMVRKYLIEDANVDPTVAIRLTDNWIEFNIRYVVDYKKRRTVRDQLSTRLLKEIEQTEGKVTLASATFEVTDVPELKVVTRQERE